VLVIRRVHLLAPHPSRRVADLDINLKHDALAAHWFRVQRNGVGILRSTKFSREGWPLSTADAISTSVERRDGATVLKVDGVVDLATSPALEELLAELIEERPDALIIDLTAVSFLASVGLRILAETHERAGGTGKFAVVASGPATARPIQLTKLDEFLALYQTADEALAALGTQP
jgi:anti-anti-sigma factor